MEQKKENRQMWAPKQLDSTQLSAFMTAVNTETGRELQNYHDVWRYSIDDMPEFWSRVWVLSDIRASHKGDAVFSRADTMRESAFFPDAQLSYAENLLRRRDDKTALVFKGENRVLREMSYKELYDKVSQTAQALKAMGVTKGDRVAGYLPNMSEAIIAMLASSSLGAIWSSASPDFGVQGVLDRFGQIEPKVLFVVDQYFYNDKRIDCMAKNLEIAGKLPTLEQVVVISYEDETHVISDTQMKTFDDFIAPFAPADIEFAQLPFDHPLYIMFSSGTTGVPKCIVHGQGGTLLQHMKEHKLHCDITADDTVFYFSTTGWMMWNWLVSALACEATVMLYDGSPFSPNGYTLFDYATTYKCSFFGTSAKFIDALRKRNMDIKNQYDLSSLRTIASTGSPLVHESFDYIYADIKQDVHVASISGGTDIISCFVLGNPISPVYRGEIQGAGLGMDIDVFDTMGKSVERGKGELVCKTPFPSMPVAFWNDPDGARYHGAYFDKFDNIWCHGDWCEWTDHDGLIIHGRSDATLNPGGVRIGTAEIYRQVEKLDEVIESVAVGQNWQDDVRVVLCVILAEGVILDEDLKKRIRSRIRQGASPRHVPTKIIAVSDIPRTKSGKITEIAVRDTIHRQEIKNTEALANPESLAYYKDRIELQN